MQAANTWCSVQPAEPYVVTMSSSDTEEALELLSLSPNPDMSSRHSGVDAQELSSSFDVGSDLCEYWPKANDMAVSVYVALIAEPSTSRALMVSAPCSEQKSHAGSSSAQGPRSQPAVLRRSRHRKLDDAQTPHKKSKRYEKTSIEDNVAVASVRGGPLLSTHFDRSEWEIMYPHFVCMLQ
jgi:hypothetical protein